MRFFIPLGQPWTRVFQILSIFNTIILPGKYFSDPAQEISQDFIPPLKTIREGKAAAEGLVINKTYSQEGSLRISLEGLGDVEGYYLRVSSGRLIRAWEGIPYAEPPIGPHRFQPPRPKEPWNGTIYAQGWPSMCTQLRSIRPGLYGEEGCLFLNIYSPIRTTWRRKTEEDGGGGGDSLLPCIVFIHGGAFAVGSSNEYGPSYLLAQDIILVTLNYRLGVFGFLSSGDGDYGGNWGLKDQALAINFVHQHIQRFNGDPKRIVLMGQSAGAVSVHLHLMSPLSKGKIYAAIALSGTAFNSWALRRSAAEESKLAKRLAALNFCPQTEESLMMGCLQSRSTSNITLAAAFLMVRERRVFQPVIEHEHPGAFISKSPTEYYEAGEVAPVPFISTMTSRELEITLAVKLARIDNLPQYRLFGPSALALLSPRLLDYQDKVRNVEETTSRIFEFYGGEDKLRSDSAVLAQIASDRHFSMGLRRTLQHHMKLAPTYTYHFNYTSDLGFAQHLRLKPYEFGVPHGEDLLFLFNRTGQRRITRSQGHFAIVKLLQTLFTNFASTGVPYYTDENFTDHSIWSAVTTVTPVPFLQIDKEVKMTSIPEFQSATDFWDSLGIQDEL